jgi:ankyrin repeat protein
MRALRLAPLPLFLALVLPEAALAQGMIRPQQQTAPTTAPAPALPGLAARRPPAPIAGDPSANLSPNAALFDAISRGDLPAARDAVSRGANLEARNQLGLTPVDAAVDQGRNEIAFFLLSARDVSRGAPAAAPAAPTGAALGAPPPAPAPRSPARREAVPAGTAAAPPAAPRAARLWAGDGGAPRPEIGFLGFDAGRPAGAEPPAAQPGPTRRAGRG